MKKVIGVLLVFCVCLCISGCKLLEATAEYVANDVKKAVTAIPEAFNEIKEDNDYVKNMCNEIVRCFDERDASSLKDLFSINIRNEYDLDSQIENAFGMYKGKSQSFYIYDRSWEGGYRDGIFYDKHFTPTIKEIVTDEGETYSIGYLTYYIFEKDKGEIGITALGLVDEDGKEIARIGKE